MKFCSKFPSMPVAGCVHCQNPKRISWNDPRYALLEGLGELSGFPFIEVLKDGGPVHRWDRHFRFRRSQAKMIVVCAHILRDFGWSTESEQRSFVARVIFDEQVPGLSVHVAVEMRPDFQHSRKGRIDRPWLLLRSLSSPSTEIGMGIQKSRALWHVRAELHFVTVQGAAQQTATSVPCSA
jgi:hypothetical protein